MVLRVDCVVPALEAMEAALPASPRPLRVLLTPQGQRFAQPHAARLVARGSFVLVCGRYEGFDDRVRGYVDEELSIGDFVLAGGEVAAMAVIEASSRLLPGVLGNERSLGLESFSPDNDGLLEFPQFTRPPVFRDAAVPEVLLSGHHAEVERWRARRARERTRERRPDLLPPAPDPPQREPGPGPSAVASRRQGK
jgi:tRNA (guanine37-N1)-methyltransferase